MLIYFKFMQANVNMQLTLRLLMSYIYIYIYIYDINSLKVNDLTLILLTWRKWWAPNKASKQQMGFNSAFKGLIEDLRLSHWINTFTFSGTVIWLNKETEASTFWDWSLSLHLQDGHQRQCPWPPAKMLALLRPMFEKATFPKNLVSTIVPLA